MLWKEGIDGNEALEIISTEEKKVCVIAGPGTGKSFALKRKVLKLLEEGNDPAKILVVTFSRTAATDLKKELLELGYEGTDKIIARTLHSFCFSVLNREGVFDSIGRETRVLLYYEKRVMLEDLRNLGLGTITELEKKLKAFEAAWARLQTEEPGWPNNEEDKLFQKELLNWLKFHDAMIIEEIVPETYKFLRDNPSAVENDMFEHIFIDEYQDLNKAEQKLLELLSKNVSSVMVIGDEDQSIYENFRHAHPEGIVEYNEIHSKGYLPLYTCRRCPQNIINIATDLISNNDIRYFDKKLVSSPEKELGEINIVQWMSLEDEIEGIVNYIKQKIEDGTVEIGQTLILSPSRHFGYMIRDKINEEDDLKAHSFFTEQQLKKGTPTKLEKCPHQRAFTLLTLLAYPEDKVALRCWLGFGSNNLRAPSYKKLRDYCHNEGESPFNIIEKVIEREIKVSGINPLLNNYKELKESIDELESLKGYKLIEKLFPKDEIWSEQFRSILNNVDEDSSPADILEELKTNIIQPEMPTDVDYVRVMSLHKSKGLTADLVIICSCVNGLIPFIEKELRGEALKRHLEEQRRLFYVGVTRTTKLLVVSTFLELPSDLAHKTMPYLRLRKRGGNTRTITSPFISELGADAPRVIRGDRWNY